MKVIGNENARKFWEKNMPASVRINESTPPEQRKAHIENKYKHRKYCDKHPAADNSKALNEVSIEVYQKISANATFVK